MHLGKDHNAAVSELKIVLSSRRKQKIYKDIVLGFQNYCSFESMTCMQHLPSVPLVLHLYFLQVHQTNIPAIASAATDPNTAPTTIPMVITKLD